LYSLKLEVETGCRFIYNCASITATLGGVMKKDNKLFLAFIVCLIIVVSIAMFLSISGEEETATCNGYHVFVSKDGAHGFELWKSDGTEAGTVMVKDINERGSSSPGFLVNVNGTVFFNANDGTHGKELWKSDCTEDGTVMVRDINPSGGSNPFRLTNVDGTVFFTAFDGTHGKELWKSDGTEDGTVMVRDINKRGSSSVGFLINVNGTLFFTADDGTHGTELWKSDGTGDGTVMVRDINITRKVLNPHNPSSVDGTLYFSAYDGTHGLELWKSDGTEAGTMMVKDLNERGNSAPVHLTNVNGTLFFAAKSGIANYELWKSDGTGAGTVMVKDANKRSSSPPTYLTNVDGMLFFTVNDGTHGKELWKSDGTGAGTVMVKDINERGSSSPGLLTNVDGTLFFTADDGTHGKELWKSDGTGAGTVMIKDINPFGGSIPYKLTNVDGTLFFTADDGTHGTELWKSDGTERGTVMAKDIKSSGIGATGKGLVNRPAPGGPLQDTKRSLKDRLLYGLKKASSVFKGLIALESGKPRQQEADNEDLRRPGIVNRTMDSRGMRNSVSPDRIRRPGAIRVPVEGFNSIYEPTKRTFPDRAGWRRVHQGGRNMSLIRNGVYVLSTSMRNEKELMYYVQRAPDILAIDDMGEGGKWVIEARVRFAYGTASTNHRTGVAIGFWPVKYYGATLFIGKDLLFLTSSPYDRGPETTAHDTDDGFHTYRIEISNIKNNPVNTIKVFYDNGSVPVLEGKTFYWRDQNEIKVWFGDGTSTASGTSEWQYIRHNMASQMSSQTQKAEARKLRRSVSPGSPKRPQAMRRSVSPDRSNNSGAMSRPRSSWEQMIDAHNSNDYKTVATLLNRRLLELEKDAKRNEGDIYMTRIFLAHVYGWRLEMTDMALKEYEKMDDLYSGERFKEFPRFESVYIGRLYEKEGDLNRALEHYRDFLDKALAQKESENDTELVMITDEMINVVKYRIDGINLKLKGKENFNPELERLPALNQPHHRKFMEFMTAIVVPHAVYGYTLLEDAYDTSGDPDVSRLVDYIMQSPEDIGSSILNYTIVISSTERGIDNQSELLMEAYLSRYPESFYSIKLRHLFSEHYREKGQTAKSDRLLKEIREIARKRGVETLTEGDARFSSPERTWALHKEALARGDIDAALGCMTPWSQKRYRKAYESLGPEKMKAMAKDLGTVYKVKDRGDEAEYDTLIEKEGHTYSYGVRFIKIYGEWKLDNY
jgi:ELWxxDGT repeat protein